MKQPPINVWLIRKSKYQRNNKTIYYNIEKSASSTISRLMQKYNNMEQKVIIYNRNDNIINNTICGFTVVRNPINRFISGYYTVNYLLYKLQNESIIPSYIKFWKIHKEPERFRMFVNELIELKWDFIKISYLSHLVTQTQILTIGKSKLDFVLKFEDMINQYNFIAKNKIECGLNVINEIEWPSRMKNYGRSKYNREDYNESYFDKYREMMGLQYYNEVNNSILPAWNAMNKETYDKIYEYYKQDFICFDYEYDHSQIQS